MKQFLERNLYWLFAMTVGLFALILWFFPFLTAYATYQQGGIIQNYSVSISGYNLFRAWSLGLIGYMISLSLIVVFIISVLLLILGSVGILREEKVITGSFGDLDKINFKKIISFVGVGYVAFNILTLFYLIIVTLTRKETTLYSQQGYRVSAGVFLAIIFFAALVVLLIVAEKKLFKSSILLKTIGKDEATNSENTAADEKTDNENKDADETNNTEDDKEIQD